MKLVKENINEFKKGLDPVDSLGLGRRVLITEWLDLMGVRHYDINDDYTIDVRGFIDIELKQLSELPEFIQFGVVNGGFWASSIELITMRGFPVHVSGSLDVVDNKLTSFIDAPKTIGGSFYCGHNSFNSLKGFPTYIGGEFHCVNNWPKKLVEKEIRKICDVKGYIYV